MKFDHLHDVVQPWLKELPQGTVISALFTNGVAVVGLLFLYWVIRRLVLPNVENLARHISPRKIGHLAPQLSKFSGRFAFVLCLLVFSAYHERLFVAPAWVFIVMETLVYVMLVVASGFLFSSLVNLGNGVYNLFPFAKEVPIQGIIQVIKLLIFIVCSILVVSILVDKSPTYILSGFGAIAAVIILVFKDTILGLVASIQIAANRLVTTGDWIQVDAFGADGEVIDLGLNTVRVRNWDNTVTTIPTYMLISDSFKNWRAMQESAGRRIKRAIHIDFTSIEPLAEQKRASLTEQYPLLEKLDDVPSDITNLGLFRRYAEAYLKQHDAINQDCLCMVRELAPTQHGLPLEFYCFSRDKRWVFYEHLQADILDYMLSVMPAFGLRPYQSVSDYFGAHRVKVRAGSKPDATSE
ncbi:mechanosensitive ion channel domain-containing protein [Pseudoalteromonas sp. S2755]|uniref:mechanosensitive ion channel family protein n=1 Tax=Pseudoalteromonas sp. S2755 TaxID=2066523 RepID=UPI00110BB517|nr:mechanosensitive ion channel domain-containing protein [Pseudoalteromonas sp. S2755]TMN36244.1 transporter [Pseudoalteromonas sp. S2755]